MKLHSRTSPVLTMLLIVGVVIVMFPFFYMILSAFKSSAEIRQVPPTFFPREISLEGFNKVLFKSLFFRWLRNSAIVSAAVTALTLFTSSVAGYIYAKFTFRFKTITFIAILSTLMFPPQVTTIPVYLICSRLHILNTHWALIVPFMVTAFGIFLCKQFIEGIPTSLIESGRVDGASEFTIYFRIIAPQVKPALSALAIFTFVNTWNSYFWPLVVIDEMKKMTVPVALNFFSSEHFAEVNTVMAAAALIVLPIVLVYLFLQRHFIEGLTLTGMK